MTATVHHYLVTLPVLEPLGVHAYVMSNEKKHVNRVFSSMMDEADKRGLHHTTFLLMTVLDPSGISTVRDVLRRQCPEAVPVFESATDFHLTLFCLDECEDNQVLVHLH